MPFLEARVFLSAEDNRLRLPDQVAAAVHTRDRDAPEDRNTGRDIVDALTRWTAESPPRFRVDRPVAKALTRAMEEAGIRQSQRARKVGDYRLDELIYEGPSYQDWAAAHVALEKERARVRVYVVEPGASEEARASIGKAAKREYAILKGISHPGILRARGYTEHERGPALIYDYLPGSQRLDHYLSERGERLSAGSRLDLIREIAEALRYAHSKRICHRALSPQNILILDPEASSPHIQIFNWQTAARERAGTRVTSLGYSMTSHLANLVEEASAVYMAPEALAERGDAGEQADVFSLGALAYHLFAGTAPARSFYELGEKLREGKGLQISSVLDGAAESPQYLIQFSTYPQVTGRLDSVVDFLDELEKFEDELTKPDPREGVVNDPTGAKPDDVLADGLVVKKRLGKGASSLALLVDNQGKEQVLKVALEPDDNARLKAEADVLRKLRRHQFIVQLHEERDYQGRVGILMDRAGDKTLAQRLRQEGRLHLELLERFGEDLLQVVDWLEQQGVSHRDIKPENLGVALMGKAEQLHLVLFDFSLADIPAENVRAGTVPYLDPFLALRKPPRWDTYAERFAAAVTLYQMATGALPTWGDGQSDPAVIDDEVSLDAAAFDATLDTLLPEIGLSPRALNAVERANLRTVRDLVHYPLAQIRRLRGVGSKTRRELADCLERLAERFPDAASQPKQLPEEVEAPVGVDETPSIDALANLLVPAGRTKESKVSARAVERMLGLGAESAEGAGRQPTPPARRRDFTRCSAIQPARAVSARHGGRPGPEARPRCPVRGQGADT